MIRNLQRHRMFSTVADLPPCGALFLGLIFAAVVALQASFAEASESVRGFLHLDGGSPYLSVRDYPLPLKILSPQPDVLRTLAFLKEGDFVVATGQLNPPKQEITINDIDSVGLQALLGVWRTEQWQVFEFRDFNRLNLYSSSMTPPGSTGLEKLREFSYVLAPVQPSQYSILLSDDHSVHAGTLQLIGEKVHITVLDSATGAVAEEINLSPLPL